MRDIEADLHPFTPAHPVALHGQDLLRPVLQATEVQELIGVGRYPQEPLLEVAPGDGGAAPLALAVDHLLVGQDRLAGGAPDHRCPRAVGQPPFVQLEEEPLVPSVVFGKTADYLPVPIVYRPHAPELGSHVVDVGHSPGIRVNSALNSGVLRRQSEGVEAHGMEYVISLHTAKAGVAVRRSHGVPMADVEVARGIGIHGELIPFGPRVIVSHPIDAVRLPPLPPFAIDFAGIVA